MGRAGTRRARTDKDLEARLRLGGEHDVSPLAHKLLAQGHLLLVVLVNLNPVVRVHRLQPHGHLVPRLRGHRRLRIVPGDRAWRTGRPGCSRRSRVGRPRSAHLVGGALEGRVVELPRAEGGLAVQRGRLGHCRGLVLLLRLLPAAAHQPGHGTPAGCPA